MRLWRVFREITMSALIPLLIVASVSLLVAAIDASIPIPLPADGPGPWPDVVADDYFGS